MPAMAGRGTDRRRFVIVGDGAAGWRAAETLRREGFEGGVTVVTDDREEPYDRIDLSSAYLKPDGTPDAPTIRDGRAIEAHGIEVVSAKVDETDVGAKRIRLQGEGARVISCDELLVATGSDARRLDAPGVDLGGAHGLRKPGDAGRSRADVEERLGRGACRIVIVGGGFIGMEAAASLGGRDGVSATVALQGDRPFEKRFGAAFGDRLPKEHRDAGVVVETQAQVVAFRGDGRVSAAELEDGRTLEAALATVAIGAEPRTGWLPFERGDDGGIDVLSDLSVPGVAEVYLAGDIARVPTPWGPPRVEHRRFAEETGELAARNRPGAGRGYEGTPYFWTMQQVEGSYTCTGRAEAWDKIDGDVTRPDFAAAFVKDGRTATVLAHGFDERVTLVEPAMASTGTLPHEGPVE